MVGFKIVLVLFALSATSARADQSALDVLHDIFSECLQDLSFSCAKLKTLGWLSRMENSRTIPITDDLEIVKKDVQEPEQERNLDEDIIDKVETFIQTHDLVAKAPSILRPDGPLAGFLPRSFQPETLTVPLASTGRSKVVKKVIVPFLLGLKFKTAVLVPLTLALIALKTWKALTLGLLSLVLTGALLIFKFTKPKVVNYEVIHYPQHLDHHLDHHVDLHHLDHHHVDHHVEHAPVAGWEHQGYGREIKNAQEMAYNAYL